MQKGASAIITKVGSYTVWQNGTDARLKEYDTNGTKIANWAFGNLTAGRTWIEKVVFKGNFILTGFLDVPDYTEVEIQGSLVAGANLDYMIRSTHLGTAAVNWHIKIHGGIIDGAKSTYTVKDAIRLQAWRSSIYNIEIRNISGNATRLSAYNASYKSIEVSFHNFRTTDIDKHGIVFESFCTDNIIESSILRGGTTNNGTAIVINPVGSDYAGGQLISNTHAYSWVKGIHIKDSSDNQINNFYFDTIGEEAILVEAIGSNVRRNKFTVINGLGIGIKTDNTTDAIVLDGQGTKYVQWQQFSNVHIVDHPTITNDYKDGFVEQGNVQSNSLTNAKFEGHDGQAVNIISATLINVVDKDSNQLGDVSQASYTVYPVGSNYYMEDSFGKTSMSTNASEIINWAIGNVSSNGRIFFKQGDYDIGANVINITMSAGDSLILEGEGQTTTITGNGTKIIDFTNTAWIQGDNSAYVTIRNMQFLHSVPNNNSVTLDLTYSVTNLYDVTVENEDVGDGVGIKIGPKNNPFHLTWTGVEVIDYAVNYDISIDHLTAFGVNSIRSRTASMYLHNSGFNSFTNVFSLQPQSGSTVFKFSQIDIHTTFYRVDVEGTSMDYVFDYTTNQNYRVEIYGYYVHSSITPDKLMKGNTYERVILHSYPDILTPSTYTVYKVGTLIFLQHSQYGLQAYGTNASQIINWAIGNLTSGRTWQEKVLLKGDFTLTGFLNIPSYTELEIQGSLIAGTNLSYMIRTENLGSASATDIQVHIHGGILDGQKGTYSVTDALRVQMWRSSISDMYIKNVDGNAINLDAYDSNEKCIEVTVDNIITAEIDGHGILLHSSSTDNIITNSILKGGSTNAGNGLYIKSWANFIDNVHIYNFLRGYVLEGAGRNDLSNIYADNLGREAILVYAKTWRAYANSFVNVKIVGPSIEQDNTYDAIVLNGTSASNYAKRNSFVNVKVAQSGDTAANYTDGFVEIGFVGENTLNTATFEGHDGDAVNIISATLTNVVDKNGKVSENTGLATSCTNGTWIQHDLIGTNTLSNTFVTLTISGSAMGDVYPVIVACIAMNATHFQVEILEADGSVPSGNFDVNWYAEYKP